jgi:putative alpha-1,2-mannosidase
VVLPCLQASFRESESQKTLKLFFGANEKVKVATAFISIDQARMNQSVEISGWDFRDVVKNTCDIWQENLNRIEVKRATGIRRPFFAQLYPTQCGVTRIFSFFIDRIGGGQ